MSLKPKSIGKSTLLVTEMDRSIEFFQNILGLKQIETVNDTIKFDLGNAELELVEKPDDVKYTSISSPDESDITINVDQNINNVVTILGMNEILLLGGPEDVFIAGNQYQSVTFRDPDDHLIEIRSNDLVELNRFDKQPEKARSSLID